MKMLKIIFNKVRPDKSSLGRAIQELNENRAASLKREVCGLTLEKWYCYKPLPNVADFRIILTKLDRALLRVGLIKKLPGTKIDYVPFKNKSLNRFVAHQLIRMNNADNKTYWQIQKHLILRSRVFYMMFVRKIIPRWHREMPLRGFLRLRQKYLKVANDSFELRTWIDAKRVYIKKHNGKWRPLGVPKLEWRIFLHGLNCALIYRLGNYVGKYQHAFRPHNGTLSAWKEIMRKVIHAKNIYEFDLKGFFDNVSLDALDNILNKLEISSDFGAAISVLNKSLIKLPKKQLLEEIDETLNTIAAQARTWETAEWIMNYEPLIPNFLKTHGVPQGSPMSPFLSTLVIEEYLFKEVKSQGHELLMYADDGMIFSEQGINFKPSKETIEAGMEFNLEKSWKVKEDGKWLRKLKFLGLVYDGNKNTWRADTRKGSKLLFDKYSLLEAQEEGFMEDYPNKNRPNGPLKDNYQLNSRSWLAYVNSKFAGYIQSKLYNGSWDNAQFVQNFEMRFKSGTWVYYYEKWIRITKRNKSYIPTFKLNVFNSSSIAILGALEGLRLQDKMPIRRLIKQNILNKKLNTES